MADLNRAIWWVFSLFCHQLPERSPNLFGMQFPLCWRCTGIAMGSAVLVLYLFKVRRMPGLGLSLALALLLPIDVISAMTGLSAGHNGVRFITGALWGFFGVAAAPVLFVYFRRSTRDLHDEGKPGSEKQKRAWIKPILY